MKRSGVFEGGCHCGAVRFQVQIDSFEAVVCNCSICRKKGFLHLIVSKEQFTLLSGQKMLSTYTFQTHTAKHTFCRVCGIHSFYTPRSHPDGFSVNLRCLDEDMLEEFVIKEFDGKNWEQKIDTLLIK